MARFDTEHLREIYFDYNKTVIAIPLYLVAFCLHQACSNTDNRLALVHYNLNDSLWENVRASGASSFGTEALFYLFCSRLQRCKHF